MDKETYAYEHLYWSLKKIAGACDLKLKKISDDEYVLFRIGETEHDPVGTYDNPDQVVVALTNHIYYKTTADVNRGIYLHKEKGIEKYR